MDELEKLAQHRNAFESMLKALLAEPVQRYQLFGAQYFLKRFDCKNFAFNPDKLMPAGVVITNKN